MINVEVLSEKMKYLITMNAKSKMFNIMSVHIEFEYTDQDQKELSNYGVDVKFDYEGPLDWDVPSFAHDIQRMSHKFQDILNEYVITQEGKIVSGNKSNVYSIEPLIYNINYKVDELHMFELGYSFKYAED
jgi:hypothetical protein